MNRIMILLAYTIVCMPHVNAQRCMHMDTHCCTTEAVYFFWTDLSRNLLEIITPCRYAYHPMTEGLVFDGSSVTGYRSIDESDQPLIPDSQTANYLHINGDSQAYVFCDAATEDDAYTTDSRTILKQAVHRALDYGYTMSVGAEIEFYFQHPDGTPADMHKYCQSCDTIQGYELQQGLIDFLEANEIPAEKFHREVGPGQYEIVLHHADPVTMADNVMLTEHLVKLYASKHGLRASFAPKPYADQNGNAMHVHFSISDAITGENAFAADEHSPIGRTAQQFMAGILNRVQAGTAFLNPTRNSFDRLQPGYEAPVAICWSHKNRSALIRLPHVGSDKQSGARAEIRSPDSSSNPYLVFSFLLHAGLEGIRNTEELPQAVTRNVYTMNEMERHEHGITMLPTSQEAAFDALALDTSLRSAFGSTFIDQYIATLTE